MAQTGKLRRQKGIGNSVQYTHVLSSRLDLTFVQSWDDYLSFFDFNFICSKKIVFTLSIWKYGFEVSDFTDWQLNRNNWHVAFKKKITNKNLLIYIILERASENVLHFLRISFQSWLVSELILNALSFCIVLSPLMVLWRQIKRPSPQQPLLCAALQSGLIFASSLSSFLLLPFHLLLFFFEAKSCCAV